MITAIKSADSASFPAVMENLFDVQSVLHWFAVNILSTAEDSYCKNYYLYRDTSKSTQQWTVIPWDYDLSCGRTGDVTIPYPWSLLNDLFVYSFEPLAGPGNVLKDRFRRSPVLMERLRTYLDSLFANVWAEEALRIRIDGLASVVESGVISDPEKWCTFEDCMEQIEALKYYVTARRNYLVATFLYPAEGDYHKATIRPTQPGVPYHGIAIDGRQVATLTFSSFESLDSIVAQVHTNDAPPGLTAPARGNYINRWLELTPYPSTARFNAVLQWSWNEYSQAESEVKTGDERSMQCHFHREEGGGRSYIPVPSFVNAYGNFVDAEISETMCGPGRHFAVLSPAAAGVVPAGLPFSIALHQNYPNPFNPATTIPFDVPSATTVRIEVYDMLGRLVVTLADGTFDAGRHSVLFDASSISSGPYVYRLTANRFVQTRKMLLLR
jgi:hypothetical protein